ncbi:class F sortase [Microbacterium sp. 4R-513]|uniref:class F sortase n=1 Tax=Microbacterium sp. 4R-513 TaxID=2567934 RepID=UPI0013E1B046|nr:class F sortase [Microbacterium sp. 4R-513]QIG38822.1 class F sortase [Microbacterium sp. 4R-513]
MSPIAARARTAGLVAAIALCLVLPGCATPGRDEASWIVHTPIATPAAPASATPAAANGVIEDVPVAAPMHLSFPAAGIDGDIEEYTAADAAAAGGIDPATLDTISWYSGVPDPMPGSDARNTVYIFGHSWVEPAVFNGLKDVQRGDEATVTTAAGELVYKVVDTLTLAKGDFSDDPAVAAVVPGRLALVTCSRPDGWDPNAHAPDNTVVFLHLVAARAAD